MSIENRQEHVAEQGAINSMLYTVLNDVLIANFKVILKLGKRKVEGTNVYGLLEIGGSCLVSCRKVL